MATSELACTYAVSVRLSSWGQKSADLSYVFDRLFQALILSDDGLEITADNILALTKAATIEVEPYWPGLFAKLFDKKYVEDLISNIGAGEDEFLSKMHQTAVHAWRQGGYGILACDLTPPCIR